MFKYHWSFEEDDENTPITSFGEDTRSSATPKEMDEASEEIEEEEKESMGEDEEETPVENISGDEYSEDELEGMTDASLVYVRITPYYRDGKFLTFKQMQCQMEYGTPSGIEPVGCPSCGDAADAAIIDSEVSPAEGTVPDSKYAEGDNAGGGDTGFGGGEESEFGGEDEGDFEFLYKDTFKFRQLCDEVESNPMWRETIFQDPKYEEYKGYLKGHEDFTDFVAELLRVLVILMRKAAQYGRVAYLFSRNKISASFMNLTTISKLWTSKLRRNLDKVDNERLDRYEVEAFPYELWVQVTKTALEIYRMVEHAKRIVFDGTNQAVTKDMAALNRQLKEIGIVIQVEKSHVDMNKLLDQRVRRSVNDLGFTKPHIENCARYLSEIGRCIPRKDVNTLKSATDDIMKELSERSKKVNDAVESGELKKGSPAYKKQIDYLTDCTFRLGFVMVGMQTSFALFEIVTNDILKIFSKYEDAFDNKALVED